jgi:hypothetical protein
MPAFAAPAEALAYAARLMGRYSAARPLYSGLDERERGPADELVVLAAGALVRAHLLAPAGAVHLLQVGAGASNGGQTEAPWLLLQQLRWQFRLAPR